MRIDFGEKIEKSNEKGGVIFEDLIPPEPVHFNEWRTRFPVKIDTPKIFAKNDFPISTAREFSRFTLKLKSPGSSNFDRVTFEFTPHHPYQSVATSNRWTNLGPPILSNGNVSCTTDTIRGVGQRFYRIVTLP